MYKMLVILQPYQKEEDKLEPYFIIGLGQVPIHVYRLSVHVRNLFDEKSRQDYFILAENTSSNFYQIPTIPTWHCARGKQGLGDCKSCQ